MRNGRQRRRAALFCTTVVAFVAGCSGDRDTEPPAPPAAEANLAFIDVQASQAVLAQVPPTVAQFFSYDFRNLDKHAADIQAATTARFWSDLEPSLELIRGVAPSKQVVATAEVVGTSLRVLEPSRAKLLLFVNRSTTEAGGPPRLEGSSVLVTAARTGTQWQIDGLELI